MSNLPCLQSWAESYWLHAFVYRPASGVIRVVVPPTEPPSPRPTPAATPPPTTVPWGLDPAKASALAATPSPNPALPFTNGPPRSHMYFALEKPTLNPSDPSKPLPDGETLLKGYPFVGLGKFPRPP